MKEILEQLDNIKFDHSRWLNELVFSAKEIKLYQKRILEMLDEFVDKEKMEELTAMFEKFDKQKKQAIGLQSKITKHVINNSRVTHSNGALKAMINSDHSQIRQKIETFRHQYANLKENFHRFSALQH